MLVFCHWFLQLLLVIFISCARIIFVYASSQWEMTLHCNVISHWWGACTKTIRLWRITPKPWESLTRTRKYLSDIVHWCNSWWYFQTSSNFGTGVYSSRCYDQPFSLFIKKKWLWLHKKNKWKLHLQSYISEVAIVYLDILRPEQNGQHFADMILFEYKFFPLLSTPAILNEYIALNSKLEVLFMRGS